MSESPNQSCAAFDGARLAARGALADVAVVVGEIAAQNPMARLLVFDDRTGGVIDLPPTGLPAAPAADDAPATDEVPARGRGRPKLGVVAREVTLLPRHWDWLASQPGGASHALRRLVDAARRADGDGGRLRAARDAAYRFMSAMAGDLPGFEEAARALFAGDTPRFCEHMAAWPADIRDYAQELASVSGGDAAP